jgi:asparagine synthase (glutamine-hydrolysing)
MLRPIARVLDLVPDDRQRLYRHTAEQAREILRSEQPERLLEVDGSFALTARVEERVLMARSLDRPLRYFLAKEQTGPMLIVAERIDEIHRQLVDLGYGSQFHPTYTRMVPAHHVTALRLIGCPDPNPEHRRFFDPPLATLPPELDLIGERYVGALLHEVRGWLEAEAAAAPAGPGEPPEPIGVCFSGGIDSGAVLLAVYHSLLDLGQSPARLKAFTLSVGGEGEDAAQAREFLRRTGLEMLGEVVERPLAAVDPFRAIEVIEDYKPLDVECAAVGLALLEGIRERYPEWRLLIDGDGGDEDLKDYPIEENAELTIRSVVSNQMLYQEGWGVDAIKHSLTYSGGQSRGCVRTFAPARELGFVGFSPFTRPAVIAVAESIPFDRLAQGSNERLYSLKGEVVRRGFRRLLGVEMPIFEKRRFQHGATPAALDGLFAVPAERYRQHFLARYARV